MAVVALILLGAGAAEAAVISGTVYTDEGVTNAGAGLTVRLIVNGVDNGTDVTDTGGAYSIVATLSGGDAMLVYVDEDSIDATTVTVSDGADLSGFDIYADHVITRHDNGGTLSNADMDAAKGSFSDAEIEYSVTAGALTVPSPNELYVPTGRTFAPDADVTTYDVEVLGTLNLSNLTISVERDWVAGSGTISGPTGPGEVLFISGSATFVPGPSPYPKVTVSLSPGSTLTLGGALDVDNFLHIDSGTLDVSASNYAIFAGNAFRNLDTFTARSGTVTFDGTGQKIEGSTTFYNLTKSVAVTETLTFQASQTTTINGTVTLNGVAGNLLSLRSDSPGTRWNFIVAAGATKAIDYVDVQDSDASGSDASQKPIGPTNSVDSGNTIDWFSLVMQIVKRAFLPDGTPIPSGATIPNIMEFKFLLYINNKDVAKIDVSVRDVLDATFQYQLGTIQVDSSVAECVLTVCTAAEELAIFTAVNGAAFLSDAVDGDVASYTGASSSVDAGNSTEANLQLDINADAVWAILFSTKIP